MSSKAKQVLLWVMIISSALLFVYFLQAKQTDAPKDLTVNAAITRINNKDFKKADFGQSQVEFTDKNDGKFVTTIGSDHLEKSFLLRLLHSTRRIQLRQSKLRKNLFLAVGDGF